MNYDFHPKLKPLFEDLSKTSLGKYLVTTEYNRFLIKHGFENHWEYAHKERKNNTYVISIVPWDTKPYEYKDSFFLLIDKLYNEKNKKSELEFLLLNTLIAFFKYVDEPIKNISEIYEDLELLGLSQKSLDIMKLNLTIFEQSWQESLVTER
jgi:hypothetical protein